MFDLYWADEKAYSLEWERRSITTAEILKNSDFAFDLIVEFGCGPHGALRKALMSAELGHIKYLATDAVSWSKEILKVQISESEKWIRPIQQNVDFQTSKSKCAILLGVVEYLSDVPALLKTLSQNFNYVIFSYCCQRFPYRVNVRWINHFSIEEILNLADLEEMRLLQAQVYESFEEFTQTIFIFETYKPY